MIGLPRVLQVSYGATSSVFSDKDDFPYFLRTVPGDAKLVRAIIALLNKYASKKLCHTHMALNEFKQTGTMCFSLQI